MKAKALSQFVHRSPLYNSHKAIFVPVPYKGKNKGRQADHDFLIGVISINRTENAIFTNMCMIFDHNGNVLLEDRTSADWPGITFPGGHVEKGESFTDAAIREVFEETGLTVSNLQMCGVKDWVRDDGTRYIVLLYRTNKFEGELSSSDEGEVWWASLSELPNM